MATLCLAPTLELHGISNIKETKVEKRELRKTPSFVYSWPSFVTNTNCDAITVPIKGLVQAKATDTVRSVLWTLIKNKVDCVPVYNEGARKYVGFVDMYDLVKYIANAAGSAVNRPDFFQVFKRQSYGDTQVAKIINGTKDCNTVTESSPLSSLFDLTVATNLPHLPIMHKHKVVDLVSQSRIVKYLVNHLACFKLLAAKKVSQLDLSGTDNVYTIEESTTCASAFVYMAEKGVRGLAVVNADGQIVDAINTFDMKGLVHGDFFSDLRQPVLRYLAKYRILLAKNLTAVVCTQDETLAGVLQKMCQERVYRVFIVDENRKPISVISLRDILKVMHSFNHQLEEEEARRTEEDAKRGEEEVGRTVEEQKAIERRMLASSGGAGQ